MGLNVDASTDILAVTDINSFFDVFMDAAYDEEAGDGYEYGEGTPVANQLAAGQLALPAASICLSMGGLGETVPATPPTGTVNLCDIDLGGAGTVTLAENGLRGGVVGAAGALTTNLPITDAPITIGCTVAADEAAWIEIGSPQCWCMNQYQCHGDINGQSVGIGLNKKYVTYDDLVIFNAAYLMTIGDPLWAANPEYQCADLNHGRVGIGLNKKFVTYDDLVIFNARYLQTSGSGLFTTCPAYNP